MKIKKHKNLGRIASYSLVIVLHCWSQVFDHRVPFYTAIAVLWTLIFTVDFTRWAIDAWEKL